jgi:hypothetical protein
MCRWFAYLAPEEETILEDVLITPVSCLQLLRTPQLTAWPGTCPLEAGPRSLPTEAHVPRPKGRYLATRDHGTKSNVQC